MNSNRRMTVLWVIVLIAAVTTGCNLFSKAEPVDEFPGEMPPDPRVVLFEDDFSSVAVGEQPGDPWFPSSNSTGHLQVVEDPDTAGGKAVQILGNIDRATSMAINFPFDDPIVVLEHSFRYEKGFGLNYWLDYAGDAGFDGHNVNWYPTEDGELLYTVVEGGSIVRLTVGQLEPGWNDVRIIADFDRQEAYVYLNGVERLTRVPLWKAIDDWDRIRLTFYDTGRWDQYASVFETESYYTDVKIWAVPASGAAAFRHYRNEYFD